MKKLLLGLVFACALSGAASAQSLGCVGVGGVNNAPPPGVSCPTESITPAYVTVGSGLTPAASATDLACVTGSATKTVRVQRIRISGTAGTSLITPVLITKHTVANTGGTSAAVTPVSLDTSNTAATATSVTYSANPTVDATATKIDVGVLLLAKSDMTAGSGAAQTAFDYSGVRYGQAPTLRGVAQQLCVNLGGATISSGVVNVSFEWIEY